MPYIFPDSHWSFHAQYVQIKLVLLLLYDEFWHVLWIILCPGAGLWRREGDTNCDKAKTCFRPQEDALRSPAQTQAH